jgi:hypothetical protein
MFVNGGLADARGFRNRIHTGTVDTTLGKQLSSSFENLFMRARAPLPCHG